MPLMGARGGGSVRGFGRFGISRPVVTGGTLSSDATYYYRTFTSSGDLNISGNSITADVLMIGGGGASNIQDGTNSGSSGGGGAGGAVYGTGRLLTPSIYPVVIGAGGSRTGGQSGNDSTFNSITAKGGGGAYKPTDGSGPIGRPGGCGGGMSDRASPGNISNQGTFSGYTSYGNRGGRNAVADSYSGGKFAGGGGLGGFIDYGGGTGNTAEVNGGPGLNTWSSWATVTSTGVSGFYGGGGGGHNGYNGGYGAGGSGGGGAASRPNATSGTANTGGGGGSSGDGNQFVASYGGNGGSGLFIIRYTKVQVD